VFATIITLPKEDYDADVDVANLNQISLYRCGYIFQSGDGVEEWVDVWIWAVVTASRVDQRVGSAYGARGENDVGTLRERS
jgi:hypothetical protein